MSSADDARRSGSDSARRIIETLFAFTEDSPSRSVKELSAQLDIPVPSMHRYVSLLRQMGVVTDASKGVYQLTPRVLLLSRAASRANPVLETARPHLAALAMDLDETVLLVQLIDGSPICVDRYESTRVLRLSFQPGQSMPSLRGASIKVLLGGLSPAERAAYLRRAASRPGSEAVGDAWDREVQLAGERGWAISMQEAEEGVWAGAAAVMDHGRVVASVTVPCPAFRLTESSQRNILKHVRNTAHEISQDFESRIFQYT